MKLRVLGAAIYQMIIYPVFAAGFSQFVDPNPNVGGQFGDSVVVLSTGNVVITDPYDNEIDRDSGAVYLFNGASGALISKLTGSSRDDRIGYGVVALGNGNFVTYSPRWSQGRQETNAGAVTWGSGTTGIEGKVSPDNSLVGSARGDDIGNRVHVLTNGNYVVDSPNWSNGAIEKAGAVTWGDGNSGVAGFLSPSNSLVGTREFESLGNTIALPDGNYVVINRNWVNSKSAEVGAVTWGDGNRGITGVITPLNSIVGSTEGDGIGSGGVTPLSDGNYVVSSPHWRNGDEKDAGAVTWVRSSSAVGVVSSSNSLVGSTSGDAVGEGGIRPLGNGNYIVLSPKWQNNAGAVTWVNGKTGVSGEVSINNSLVGSTENDMVGVESKFLSNGSVVVLPSSNYVIASPRWNNNKGAVTWGDGSSGVSGTIALSNSLIGADHPFDPFIGPLSDQVGSGGITVLSNGSYVVISDEWNNGKGAVTWSPGSSGVVGQLDSNNSLIGTDDLDHVGSSGVISLSNGNYVVASSSWGGDEGGAVTWGDGSMGTAGRVSRSNSLVGGRRNSSIGYGGILALTNGNYVVVSPSWDSDLAQNVGAVTWGNGNSGTFGVVSADNSLVGSHKDDKVGAARLARPGVVALSNGNYVVQSALWDFGEIRDVGAVTWGDGVSGIRGIVSSDNSLHGSTTRDLVGEGNIYPLQSGDYLVFSSEWQNQDGVLVGAATWGNGTIGVSGKISADNSLVGSPNVARPNYAEPLYIGPNIMELANGNFVIRSYGAVTWGSKTEGINGEISADNSLLGDSIDDAPGERQVKVSGGIGILSGLTPLPNGNYLVLSSKAQGSRGAVTFGIGVSGVKGRIAVANSIIGENKETELRGPYIDNINNNFIVTFMNDAIGGGIVHVGSLGEAVVSQAPSNGYKSWILGHTTSMSGGNEDPDKDGTPNILEYFHGTSPVNGKEHERLQVLSDDSENYVVTFQRSKHISGIISTLIWSKDLVSWQTSGESIDGTTVEFTESIVADRGLAEQVQIEAKIGPGRTHVASFFIALRVEEEQ